MIKKIAVAFLIGGGGYLIWRALNTADKGIDDAAGGGGFSGGLIDAAYGLGAALAGGVNDNMKISAAGLDFIKKREGLRTMPYYATEKERQRGILTIGYGYTYKTSDLVKVAKYSKGITDAEAVQLLIDRVAQDERAIRSGVKVKLTQNQFDALVSLRYNVGSLANSNLIKKLNSGDYYGAADEILGWVYQDGQFITGLYKRRASEQQMFINGTYDLVWN